MFAPSNLIHFTPRIEATITEAAIVTAKNVWSTGLRGAALVGPVATAFVPLLSQPAGVLEEKANTISIGIHTATLTDFRRLQSRTRRTAINNQQRRVAIPAIC